MNAAEVGATGRVGSEAAPIVAWAGGADEAGVVKVGSLRTKVGTSGRGASSARSASISCRLRRLALVSTAWWFSGVRCRAKSRTEVRVISPEASRSRLTGKRRQARADSILLQAASSDSRRDWVQ